MSTDIPVQSRIRWVAVLPQFVACAFAIVVAWPFASTVPQAVVWGTGAYLVYSYGSRALIPRAHRRGSQLFQSRQYEQAIDAYMESFAFFARHAWLDRYRSLTMMTPSVFTYQEMALWNSAACFLQLDDARQARECYERMINEFPPGDAARTAIEELEAIKLPAHVVDESP